MTTASCSSPLIGTILTFRSGGVQPGSGTPFGPESPTLDEGAATASLVDGATSAGAASFVATAAAAVEVTVGGVAAGAAAAAGLLSVAGVVEKSAEEALFSYETNGLGGDQPS